MLPHVEAAGSAVSSFPPINCQLQGEQDVLVPSAVGGCSVAYGSEVLLLEACAATTVRWFDEDGLLEVEVLAVVQRLVVLLFC